MTPDGNRVPPALLNLEQGPRQTETSQQDQQRKYAIITANPSHPTTLPTPSPPPGGGPPAALRLARWPSHSPTVYAQVL